VSTVSLRTVEHVIGGSATRGDSARVAPIWDQSTGEQQAEVALAAPSDIDAAVRTAAAAFENWQEVSLARRARTMFAFRDLVNRHVDDLAIGWIRVHFFLRQVEFTWRGNHEANCITMLQEAPRIQDKTNFADISVVLSITFNELSVELSTHSSRLPLTPSSKYFSDGFGVRGHHLVDLPCRLQEYLVTAFQVSTIKI